MHTQGALLKWFRYEPLTDRRPDSHPLIYLHVKRHGETQPARSPNFATSEALNHLVRSTRMLLAARNTPGVLDGLAYDWVFPNEAGGFPRTIVVVVPLKKLSGLFLKRGARVLSVPSLPVR
jgi:hypothetical protein